MSTLANLESFVRSAEAGSFSAAARLLGLSPAAVAKNVARLEAGLGVLLFQRSTRRLTLTEAGERFWQEVAGGLDSIQGAIANVAQGGEVPAGTLKVSLPVGFGFEQILPLMAEFTRLHPAVTPELHFENRQVDLIAEGLDVAIGGAIDLAPGIVARELLRIHVVALAAPGWRTDHPLPMAPADLSGLPGIVLRSVRTGRLRAFTLRNAAGEEETVALKPALVVNDPDALCRATATGMGVTLAPLTQAAAWLERGDLVRLLPGWHADLGPVSLYYSSRRLLPAKTRAFIDFVADRVRQQGLARRFSAV